MPVAMKPMTSKERVLAALKREPVDYVPCSPFFNPLREQQRVGYRWQFPWGPSPREKLEYQIDVLGVDPTVGLSIPRENPAPGVSERVWLDVADSVIHKVWATPAGELHAAVRYDKRWPHGLDVHLFSDFNIGHFVEPWVKSQQDVECLRHILRIPDEKTYFEQLRFAAAETRRLAERLRVPIMSSIGLGLTGAHHLFGSTQLCMKMMDEPDLVDSYLEIEHRLNLRCMELAADLGADIIRRNGFYETADFYGPDMLGRFIGERLRKEVQAIRQAGKLSTYTVHTGVMPILGFLKTVGFDCLMHIDTGFKGVDLPTIRDSQEGKKSFWLGPSNTFHMWEEDPETVRASVREVFEVFGKRGLLITPCPSAHSIMPWENTLAMVDEWKKLRGA